MKHIQLLLLLVVVVSSNVEKIGNIFITFFLLSRVQRLMTWWMRMDLSIYHYMFYHKKRYKKYFTRMLSQSITQCL